MRHPSPDEVVGSFVEVAALALRGDYEGLCSLVEQEDYRRAFVRLMRNVVPDGTQVGEVEFRRTDDPKEKAVVFLPAHRESLRHMQKRCAPPTAQDEPSDQVTQLVGILRAVDLDRNRLRVDAQGSRVEFSKADDILDDAVGPLLNKCVTVTGRWKPRGRNRLFLAVDIELHAAQAEI